MSGRTAHTLHEISVEFQSGLVIDWKFATWTFGMDHFNGHHKTIETTHLRFIGQLEQADTRFDRMFTFDFVLSIAIAFRVN